MTGLGGSWDSRASASERAMSKFSIKLEHILQPSRPVISQATALEQARSFPRPLRDFCLHRRKAVEDGLQASAGGESKKGLRTLVPRMSGSVAGVVRYTELCRFFACASSGSAVISV